MIRFLRFGLIIGLLWLLPACGQTRHTPTIQAAPSAISTLSPAELDATAGALERPTHQAKSTANAYATVTQQALATDLAWIATHQQAHLNETATVTAAYPMLAEQQSWPVQFTETFDNNQNRWQVGSYQEEHFTYQRQISGGRYFWTLDATEWSDAKLIAWPVWDVEFTDFYAEIEAQPGSENAVTYGLVFRMQDEKNFYYIGLCNDSVEIHTHFSVIQGGEEIDSEGYVTQPYINSKAANRLAVAARGIQFIVVVNGHIVGVIEDARFRAGRVGLGMEAFLQSDVASAFFENFEVHAP